MFDSDRIDPTALQDWRQRPLAAFRCWLFAGLLTMYPHEYNASTRKIVTILVFAAWATIEILYGAGIFQATGVLMYLRPAVFLILGQMWGIELTNMQAFGEQLATASNEDDDQ